MVTEQLQVTSTYDRLIFIQNNLFVHSLSHLSLPEKTLVTDLINHSLWALKHTPCLKITCPII